MMMSSLRTRLAGEAGITLSETVVVVAIIGIVIGALAGVLSMAIRSSDQLRDQSTQQTEVRASVDQLVREVRQAYSGDSTYPILTATSTTLEFLSPDIQVPFHNRKLAYRLTGGHVDRAITTSSDTDGAPWAGWAWSSFAGIPSSSWAKQLTGVRNTAVFTYYDSNGNQLTGSFALSSIERVQVSITVSTDGQPARQYTYTQSASLRWAPE
jgi:type II secretory pathway pseudopilin PulG